MSRCWMCDQEYDDPNEPCPEGGYHEAPTPADQEDSNEDMLGRLSHRRDGREAVGVRGPAWLGHHRKPWPSRHLGRVDGGRRFKSGRTPSWSARPVVQPVFVILPLHLLGVR